jgi:hypothetical protein
MRQDEQTGIGSAGYERCLAGCHVTVAFGFGCFAFKKRRFAQQRIHAGC